MEVRKLKRELLAAALSVVVAFVALGSSTYAWYVTNTSVKASTSTISAMANGMTLQIVAGTIPDHGKDSETVAFDSTSGHEISPSSTNDIKKWYIPSAWSDGAMVSGYSEVNFSDATTGEYKVSEGSEKKFYAYNVSTYTVYTIRDTGIADIYLDGSQTGGAITVTSGGAPLADKIAKSLRVGISTVDKNGVETLKVVYAPMEPTGHGNDVYSRDNNITGWITVSDATSTKNATYSHIYGTNYVDQGSGNWAATKTGDNYLRPTGTAKALAEGIDYNGIIMKVYVWLEGTDTDCVNTSAEGVNEDLTFDVTLYMVGIDSQT